MHASQHDRADELENDRELVGDAASAVRDFASEEQGYHGCTSSTWAMTSIVDVTAAALYVRFWAPYWPPLQTVPQWAVALAALVVVLPLNLVSVRLFGEMEFWFALVKILALVAFLIIGIVFLLTGTATDLGPTGLRVLTDNGGFFPSGGIAPLLAVSGVIFAYAGIELIGTAAGETEQPEKARRPDRRAFQPQRRPVLNRENFAFHGGKPFGTGLRRQDEPSRRAVWRHSFHSSHRLALRRVERAGTDPGIRDRSRNLGDRHHRLLGDHHPLPDETAPNGAHRAAHPACLQAIRGPVHCVCRSGEAGLHRGYTGNFPVVASRPGLDHTTVPIDRDRTFNQ